MPTRGATDYTDDLRLAHVLADPDRVESFRRLLAARSEPAY